MVRINKRAWTHRRFQLRQLTEEEIFDVFPESKVSEGDVCLILQIYPEVDSLNDCEEYYGLGSDLKTALRAIRTKGRIKYK